MEQPIASQNVARIGPSERGPFRIIVQSIGTASPRVRWALRKILPLSEPQIVKVLYQAPSELISGVRLDLAEKMCEILRGTGLVVEVQPLEAPFTPGRGDVEVAMVIRDVARLSEVVALVSTLLDTPEEVAAKSVWSSPSMLLGRVSTATVEALRQRFTPLGVDLEISKPDEAVYDLFLGPCSTSIRDAVSRDLREAGVEPVVQTDPLAAEAQTLFALGLTRAQADLVWERAQRSSAPLRILDRAFQRYDVRLEEAPETDAMVDFLVADTGMPRKVVPKVIRGTPIFLHQNIAYDRANACLVGVAAQGGRATAHLLTFQSFDLEIEALADRGATARLLGAITSRSPDEALGSLLQLPLRLTGPFSHLKARWLQHELERTGARARLVLR